MARDPASLSILVVDDFRDGADSLANLLRFFGHGVQVAYDPASALAAEKPDVVILELRLPGMDGWELVRQMRQRWTTQPRYIAVTTCGQVMDRRGSEEVGIDPHLVKPVDPVSLIEVLRPSIHAG